MLAGVIPTTEPNKFEFAAIIISTNYYQEICGNFNASFGMHINQEVYNWVNEDYEKETGENLCQIHMEI